MWQQMGLIGMTRQEQTCQRHKAYMTPKRAIDCCDEMKKRLQRTGDKDWQRLTVFECAANSIVGHPHYHVGRAQQPVPRRIKRILTVRFWRAVKKSERAYLQACDAKAALDHAEN